MKKLFSVLLTALILTLTLSACSDNLPGENLAEKVSADENASYKFDSDTYSPTSYASYKTSAVNFSINMLKSLKKSGENTYSPMALYYQLSLLQNAASDDTKNSIKKLTGENLSLDEFNESNGYFFSRLESLGRKNEKKYLEINGSFFFNEKTPASQSFLLANADFYNQDIFRLSFSQDSFSEKINSFLSDKNASYNGKPDNSSGLLLINIASLNDSWLNGYESKDISSDFFNGKNKSRRVSFLKSAEFYLEGKDCEGFIKDFKNAPAKFIAILPKENDTDKFLEKFNADSFYSLIKSMKVTKTCEAYLPEFSDKAELSLINSESLKFLGEKGSYNSLAYNAKAKVSDISQSFNIKISRRGAGKAKAVYSNAVKAAPKKTVKLNRPFIYMVVDNESYLPIFMGAADDI